MCDVSLTLTRAQPRRRSDINQIKLDKLIHALKKDKKNVGNKLGLILNNGYGKIFKKLIEPNQKFKNILIEYLKSI